MYVVDDDASVCDGLARLIRSEGYRVECFPSASDFLERVGPDATGCLLLDVRLPNVTGPELHRELRRKGYLLPVVFLTGHGDVLTGVEAMKQGAVDFLLKPVDDELLLGAVAQAQARARAIRTADVERETALSSLRLLSKREHEVVRLVADGRLNKQIAGTLGISEKTVKVHRHRALQKLGIRSVADLVRFFDVAAERPEPPPG